MISPLVPTYLVRPDHVTNDADQRHAHLLWNKYGITIEPLIERIYAIEQRGLRSIIRSSEREGQLPRNECIARAYSDICRHSKQKPTPEIMIKNKWR